VAKLLNLSPELQNLPVRPPGGYRLLPFPLVNGPLAAAHHLACPAAWQVWMAVVAWGSAT
jgi:hypothetical protein